MTTPDPAKTESTLAGTMELVLDMGLRMQDLVAAQCELSELRLRNEFGRKVCMGQLTRTAERVDDLRSQLAEKQAELQQKLDKLQGIYVDL